MIIDIIGLGHTKAKCDYIKKHEQCYNWYIKSSGDEKYLACFWGIKNIKELSNYKEIRKIYSTDSERFFCIADNKLLEITKFINVIERGELETDTGDVIIKDNGYDSGIGRGLIIVDSKCGYIYNLVLNKLYKIEDENIKKYKDIENIMGYYVATDNVTNRIYFSNLYNGYYWNDILLTTNINKNIQIGQSQYTITIDTDIQQMQETAILLQYDSNNWISGKTINYDATTGILTFNTDNYCGEGEYTNWTVYIYTNENLKFIDIDALNSKIINFINYNNELWIFGNNRIVIYQPSGSDYASFVRINSAIYDIGLFAKDSIIKANNRIMFLGKSNNKVAFFINNGYQLIELECSYLENFEPQNLDDCKAYYINLDQTDFCIFNFSKINKTLLYNLHNNTWTLLGIWNSNKADFEKLWIKDIACFNNYIYALKYNSNNLYAFDKDYKLYDNDKIVRMKDTYHFSFENKRIFWNELELELKTGDKNLDSNEVIMLSFSDNYGNTFSNEIFKSIPKRGEYKKRIKFNRLGSSRGRIFRIKYMGLCNLQIIKGFLDYYVS